MAEGWRTRTTYQAVARGKPGSRRFDQPHDKSVAASGLGLGGTGKSSRSLRRSAATMPRMSHGRSPHG